MLDLLTLGRLELRGDAGPPLRAQRKDLVLLAYLLRRAVPVSRDELVDVLWGDRPEAGARHALRQALLRLRGGVTEALVVEPTAVAVREGRIALDAACFEAELDAGRLEAAVSRWGGDLLAGMEDAGGPAYRAWLEAERQALRTRLGWALGALAAEAEHRRDGAAVVRWAERWAAALPHDGEPQLRLLEALAASGRSVEALARHAALEARRRSDGDAEPWPELDRLGERLRRDAGAAARAAADGTVGAPPSALEGRARELARLAAAFASVRDGGAAVEVVEGEAGMGKTRLVRELLARLRATAPEALVLRAAAEAGDAALPWALARRLLAPLRGAPGLGGAPDDAVARLAALVPSLRERFPRLPAAALSAEGAQEAVAAALTAVAAEVPVVLWVDDLPRADPPSRALVLALARSCPAGVLILLDGVEDAGRLAELRRAGAHVSRLAPLDVGAVDALASAAAGLAPGSRRELAERLHAATGGHPGDLLAVLEGLEGAAPADDPRAPLPLPPSLREPLRERIDRLSGRDRRALDACAVAERSLDATALQAALGGTEGGWAAALEELGLRGLVRPTLPGRPEPAVVAGFVGRVARDALPPRRRAALRSALSPRPGRGGAPSLRRVALATGAGVLLVVLAAVAARRADRPEPLLAVGEIQGAGPDTGGLQRALPYLLVSGLARVPGVRVLATARIHEVRAQLAESGRAPPTSEVARRAGASELLEGRVLQLPDGALRLLLERVDLRSGAVRATYAVQAHDPLRLADELLPRVAADLGHPAPTPPAGQRGTRSVVAYRFYEEGLRGYYGGDARAALGLFRAALVEDSSFAMAAYYVWLCRGALGMLQPDDPALRRAVRLARDAADPDRLLIRAAWANAMDEPERLALAETLAVRYPAEPDGPLLLGRARMWSGDFLGAAALFRRVIHVDSLGLRNPALRCRACEAYDDLVMAYQLADSLAAAERAARAWTAARPSAARAWSVLASTLEYQDRYEEALAARRRASASRPGDRIDAIYPAIVGIRAGRWAGADALLRDRIANGPPDVRREALWFHCLSLRTQGRLAEALEAARAYRRLAAAAGPGEPPPPPDALLEAQVLLESGRYRASAALFDSLAAVVFPGSAGHTARNRAWMLTHSAAALAAAGDTAALRPLAARIRAAGVRSALGRDRLLHHYVLGLLLAARNRPDSAAAELRRAVFSPGASYGRLNAELARALLAGGHPREAAAALRPAFRASLEAGGLYLTRTELHLLLARALDAAGEPDSAAVHYRWVAAAWRAADAPFAARRDSVLSRLTALRSP